jgi:hypothetical protein
VFSKNESVSIREIRGRKGAETFYEVQAGGFYEVKAGGFYEVKAKRGQKKHRLLPI